MIAIGNQLTNEQRFLRDVLLSSRSRRLRSMREFAEQEVRLPSGPHAGRRYRVDRQPYAGLLFDALQDGRWWRKVVTGPSQSGKTLQAFLIPLLYHLFEVGENVICGLPNLDMASDKWTADIKPVIEASRYRDLLPLSGAGSKGGSPRKVVFQNGSQLLFMAGGGGDKQRAGATARVLVVTETDGMDEIGLTSREGSKISQLEARTLSFARGDRRLHYFECTVSTDDGYTWREYQAGTASRIIVPCVHCGAWVTPEREHLVGWDGAESSTEAASAGKFGCPDCGECWTDSERTAMNRASRLLHRGQEVTETGEIVGTPAETDTLGFRWNAFNNELIDTSSVSVEEWKAKQSDEPDEADISLRQFVWCLPHENEKVERVDLTLGVVRGSAKGYQGRCSGVERGVVPDGFDRLTAFVDIGQRYLHWSVLAFGKAIHIVDYGFAETQHAAVVGAEQAIADELPSLLQWLSTEFPLTQGMVDVGHWSGTLLPIVGRFAEFVPSHGLGKSGDGSGSYAHPSKATADKRPSPNGEPWHWSYRDRPRVGVVNFDADAWKVRLHDALQIRPLNPDSSGCVRIFGSNPDEHIEFAKHLLAEVREVVHEKGKKPVTKWIRKSRHNHWLDCVVGCFVANSVARSHQPVQARRYGVLSKRADRD